MGRWCRAWASNTLITARLLSTLGAPPTPPSLSSFHPTCFGKQNGLPISSIQGVSRSAAVVIAYLIRNQGMSFEQAHSFLKRKRACIKPNSGFIKALQEWESLWKRPNMTRRFTT
jgi:hypothetical protein